MTVKRASLGRNLSALLSQTSTLLQDSEQASRSTQLSSPPLSADSGLAEQFSSLNLSNIQPGKYQPRRDMDQHALEELSQSIKQQGVLQPLLVRKINDDQYEILAGERRWRAAQLAGLTEIPVLIKTVDDESAMAIALIENLQREDLNALDQAYAMHRLTTEFDLTHQQVADILGKSRAAVSNFLRLLSLCDEVKRLLEHNDLDMGHARALLALAPEQQAHIASLIVAKGLSVRETEQLIQRLNRPGRDDNQPVSAEEHGDKADFINQLSDFLTQQFSTKVLIQQKQSGKGSVVIHFDSEAGLKKILEKMEYGVS